MIQLLINGFFFLACASFGMYSMHKNDSVITNRWLYLMGWFMFVCVACLSAINFINYFVHNGVVDVGGMIDKVGDNIQVSDYVTGCAYVLFGFYLFSLRKKCMTAEFLPRTFRIWFFRRLNKFRYRKPKSFENKNQLKINLKY